jgi:hypothetical protein
MMTDAREAVRSVESDGSPVDLFPLPVDEASLDEMLRDLFEHHWRDITFGPLIPGAAWEMRAERAPTRISLNDGYLTVAFGAPHFHLCIGETKGPAARPTPADAARHRRTARAELYRRFGRTSLPMSWGMRLFNGAGEQQITVILPNPFLDAEREKIVEEPDWSRLALWDALRARWFGWGDADPVDRSQSRSSQE